MKIILTMLLSIVLISMSTSGAFAMGHHNRWWAGDNSQIVADYPTGTHAIPGKNETLSGSDLVMKDGNSGDFQQWFRSDSSQLGYHSVWKYVGDATDCSKYGNDWTFIPDAQSSWGSYLNAGNYCVHTNSSYGR